MFNFFKTKESLLVLSEAFGTSLLIGIDAIISKRNDLLE